MKRKPFIFIGSSSEGKKFAEALQVNLNDDCESQIWHQGLFGLSDGTLETLIKSLDQFDFGIFMITGDDLVESRGTESKAPRDNVIFELGLFLGNLSRERVFIVVDESAKPKLPSDLAGISVATFIPPVRGNLFTSLGPASTVIKTEIAKNGLRKIVGLSKENYRNDLKIITNYLLDNGLQMISFEGLQKKVNDKFDRDYILKIIESNPDKIRRAILKGNRPGIKILSLKNQLNSKPLSIWSDHFNNLNHWKLNYWGTKNPRKTNRIENSTMIFEAAQDELLNSSGFFGAYIDIADKIYNEQTYEIRCKVSSTANTTMGFQLWIHEGNDGSSKVVEPMFPKIPNNKPEIFKARYTATESNKMRIHLHCTGGIGQIIVSEVDIYQL